MDDELRQLERVLGSLPLRKAPASLDRKILRPRRHRIWWGALGGAAAAAVLVAALLLRPPPGSPKRPAKALQAQVVALPGPVELVETMSDLFYEGLIRPDDRPPQQVFRRQTIERTLLVDTQSGYSVEVTVPRQRVLLVEVETY